MSPKGPTWRRHFDQLRPHFVSTEDTEPSDNHKLSNENSENNSLTSSLNQPNNNSTTYINPRLPTDNQFSYLNTRQSSRTRKQPIRYGSPVPN